MRDAAKQKLHQVEREARRAMIRAAKDGKTITYTRLTKEIRTRQYRPHSRDLSELLCAISRREYKEKQRLLSVVVVRKATDDPGAGFFKLARGLGCEIAETPSDERAFFEEELKRVHRCRWEDS